MSTEILVLAAGRGSRLGGLTESAPKWLLDVGRQTIADRQLQAAGNAITASGGAIDSVRVVTGHAADAIEAFLSQGSRPPHTTIFNPRYADLNNWYTVLHALNARRPAIDRVAIVNADLFAPASWLERFFLDAATTPSDSLIGVDLARTLTDESMKVSSRPGAAGGHFVDAIGKVDVSNPVGEYVGLLMVAGDVLTEFERALQTFIENPVFADAWYERAVGMTAASGTDWRIWPTPDSDWVEIDDASDHAAALALERS